MNKAIINQIARFLHSGSYIDLIDFSADLLEIEENTVDYYKLEDIVATNLLKKINSRKVSDYTETASDLFMTIQKVMDRQISIVVSQISPIEQ